MVRAVVVKFEPFQSKWIEGITLSSREAIA